MICWPNGTETTKCRYFHFRHLMKMLVVIWTYHRSDFSLFSLIITYFAYFFRFSMINFDYRRFHFVRYVFCFQYMFFHDDYCSFEGLSCSGVILFRNYPFQELLYSEWILFRNYSFQELLSSEWFLFRKDPYQEVSFSGTTPFGNFPFGE